MGNTFSKEKSKEKNKKANSPVTRFSPDHKLLWDEMWKTKLPDDLKDFHRDPDKLIQKPFYP